MARPLFLWDLFLKIAFGIIGIFLTVLFWMLAAFFLILNLFFTWDRLWRHIGVWNLAMHRFIMRRRNLYDTSLFPTHPPHPDPRLTEWNPMFRTSRSADGTFNDLHDPLMGSANTRFARNFPLKRLNELFKEQTNKSFLSPNPREVSRKLFTRDRFRPASSLNLLAAAWIQFQVHDWFNHRRHKPSDPKTLKDYLPPIPLEKDDDWPGREECPPHSNKFFMQIRRTEEDDTVDRRSEEFEKGGKLEGLAEFPVYKNTETHWWDGSQLYGSDAAKQDLLREHGNGRLRVEHRRLPEDPQHQGVDLTGFNDNWWAGLNLLHTLFALEHNAVCEQLQKAYPNWDDERLFQTARLINTALIAKIHTVEWTPAILSHPTLRVGMRANWWGIITQRLTKILGRLRILRDVQEEVTGIPGSEQDHHASPFYLTEEFVSVYRMHPLIPDTYRIYDYKTDELVRACSFDELQGSKTRQFVDRVSAHNLAYSFGVSHPGAVTLNNFPRALQNFQRTRDHHGAINPPEVLDLASIDIMRDRERAVPRYNHFRRMLMMLPCVSYERLIGVPLFPWFSSLSNRQIKERKSWVRLLKKLYPNKEDLDLMVGLHAEELPSGFGFSDTAFRIFVLMAPRRLKSDRFITTDFNPDVYTQLGLDWIEHNDLKTVLLRHYPELSPALDGVSNAFAPWQRTERPSPDPVDPNPAAADPRPEMRQVSIFQMPLFGGALVGWIVGALYAWTHSPRTSSFTLFAVFGGGPAVEGAAIGAIFGGACLAILHLISFFSTREITLREQMQTAAGIGATLGWWLGALFHMWTSGTRLENASKLLAQFSQSLLTEQALLGACIGAVVWLIRKRGIRQAFIGLAIGLLAGASWVAWQQGVPLDLLSDFTEALQALVKREALIGAFIGATIGVLFAGRQTLSDVFGHGGVSRVARRAFYGGLLGVALGGGAGALLSFLLMFIYDRSALSAATGIPLAVMVAAIGACFIRDSQSRAGWPWLRSLASGTLSGVGIGGLLCAGFWLATDCSSIVHAAYRAADALGFHMAAGAFVGGIISLFLWLFGWVAVAAVVGWLLGTATHLALKEVIPHLGNAILSSDAMTGLAVGGGLGFLLTAFIYREWLWATFWGLRAAFLGWLTGVLYYLWVAQSLADNLRSAVISIQAGWGTLLVSLFVASVWLVRGPEVTWVLRGSFWRFVGWVKFVGNQPVNIPPPRRRSWWKIIVWLKFAIERRATIARKHDGPLAAFWLCLQSRLEHWLRLSRAVRPLDKIKTVPFSHRFPVPIHNIQVADCIPADERTRVKTLFSRFQARLYELFPPIQTGQPLQAISADPLVAFNDSYSFLQRKAFDPPDLPSEYEGSPDLGSLAVRGPYACYTRRTQGSPDMYEWALQDLSAYSCHEGLYRLGAHVKFRLDPATNVLEACSITWEHGTSTPIDHDWQLAKKIALCAATTHLSLVRHFNWVHLVCGEPLAIATRTCLSSDHPVCRLLWPHIYGTLQSNYMVTLVQMVKDGDFDTIFSFTHEGMSRLFADTYRSFSFIVNDPKEDARTRGVSDLMARTKDSSQKNLESLFDVIHRHVERYLSIYYPDGTLQRNGERDQEITRWIAALNELIPSGTHVDHNTALLSDLATLLARFIYLVTVQHELLGTFLWNYQLWTHRQPIRVYRDGRREPLDVYQRLVNANFNLNVSRRSLMDDFSYLACDEDGADVFKRFRDDLQSLQDTMDTEPWQIWKVYPSILEANINA